MGVAERQRPDGGDAAGPGLPPQRSLLAAASPPVVSCGACGLQQRAPEAIATARLRCAACGYRLELPAAISLLRQRVLAFSIAALTVYPLAVTLPVMTLSRFGHTSSTSILGGVSILWQDRHWILAIVVAICSVVVPLGKLLSLLWLAAASQARASAGRRRLLVVLDASGRWGMLDVLLVAGLVAAVKLGEVVRIEPGPGAIAFAACMVLAILATAAMGRIAAAGPPLVSMGARA